MSTYKEEFFQALDNTVSLGVVDPIEGIIDHTEKFINQNFKDQTNELFQKHIVDKFKGTSYLKGGCLVICPIFKSIIQEHFDIDVTLTVGSLKFLNETAYDDSYEYIKSLVRSNEKRLGLNIHAWLTLPSLEVIDPTFYLTMNHKFPSISNLLDKIKMDSNPYNLGANNLELHPILVGEEVLGKFTQTKMFDASGVHDNVDSAIDFYLNNSDLSNKFDDNNNGRKI